MEGLLKRNAERESARNVANSHSSGAHNNYREAIVFMRLWRNYFYSTLYGFIVMASWLLSAQASAAQEVQVYEVNHIYFKVTNVQDDDVLNIRAGPSAQYDIVGRYLPR